MAWFVKLEQILHIIPTCWRKWQALRPSECGFVRDSSKQVRTSVDYINDVYFVSRNRSWHQLFLTAGRYANIYPSNLKYCKLLYWSAYSSVHNYNNEVRTMSKLPFIFLAYNASNPLKLSGHRVGHSRIHVVVPLCRQLH